MSSESTSTALAPRADRTYAAIALWASSLTRSYYRLEVCGRPFPRDEGVLCVVSHRNGLADAGLLMGVVQRPLRFLVKYKLMTAPILGAVITRSGAVPVYRKKDQVDMSRNTEAFAAVHTALARREVIAIFPEGSSHSEPQLAEMKTGAARMALGAIEAGGAGLPLLVQPIGFVYSARDRYRSRLTAVLGEPIDPSQYLAAYEQDARATVDRLTGDIHAAIGAASVELSGWSDRALVELAGQVRPKPGVSSAERWSELARGLAWLREHRPRRAEKLETSVHDLSRRLRAAHQLPEALAGKRQPGLPVAFGGLTGLAASAAVYFPPAAASRAIGLLGRPTPDKLVTVQLLSAFLLFPLWTLLLAALGYARGGWLGLGSAALVLGAAGWFATNFWHRAGAWFAALARAFDPEARDTAWQASAENLGRELDVLEHLDARLRRRPQR